VLPSQPGREFADIQPGDGFRIQPVVSALSWAAAIEGPPLNPLATLKAGPGSGPAGAGFLPAHAETAAGALTAANAASPCAAAAAEPTWGFEGLGSERSSSGGPQESDVLEGDAPALGGLLVGCEHLQGVDGGAALLGGVFAARRLARTFLGCRASQRTVRIEPPAIPPVPGAAGSGIITLGGHLSSPRLVGRGSKPGAGPAAPSTSMLFAIRPRPCGRHRFHITGLPTPDTGTLAALVARRPTIARSSSFLYRPLTVLETRRESDHLLSAIRIALLTTPVVASESPPVGHPTWMPPPCLRRHPRRGAPLAFGGCWDTAAASWKSRWNWTCVVVFAHGWSPSELGKAASRAASSRALTRAVYTLATAVEDDLPGSLGARAAGPRSCAPASPTAMEASQQALHFELRVRSWSRVEAATEWCFWARVDGPGVDMWCRAEHSKRWPCRVPV